MYDGHRMQIATGALTLTAGKVFDFQTRTSDGRWRIVDIWYRVSTTFAGATNSPSIKAGSTADDDKLIDLQDLGAIAAGDTVYSLRKNFPGAFNDTAYNGQAVLENGDTLRLSLVAAAGAGAAGVAEFWFDLEHCGN